MIVLLLCSWAVGKESFDSVTAPFTFWPNDVLFNCHGDKLIFQTY